MKIDKCDVIKNKLSVLSLLLNRSRSQIYRRIHTLKMLPLRGSKYIFCLYFIIILTEFFSIIRSYNLGFF